MFLYFKIIISLSGLFFSMSIYGELERDLQCNPNPLFNNYLYFGYDPRYEYELPARNEIFYGVHFKEMKLDNQTFAVDYTRDCGDQKQYEQEKKFLETNEQRLLDAMLHTVPFATAELLCLGTGPSKQQFILILGDPYHEYHECPINTGIRITQKTPDCTSQNENPQIKQSEEEILQQMRFIYTIYVKSNVDKKYLVQDNSFASSSTGT